jgi:antirestriction protein ArdC
MAQSASRPAARAQPAKDRSTLYEEITDKIIAQLEAGRLPWVQPWGSSGVRAPLGLPRNAATGRTYSGINVLILWDAIVEQGYSAQSWLTFRQALALGGHVRKSERGTTVVYADRFVPDDLRDRAHERGEEPRGIPFLKRFTVFNVEQCAGLPDGIAAPPPLVDASLILPQVEELIRATKADIRIGGDKAYYDVAGDYIRVPPPQAFYESVNWHRTSVHELSHWTGAPNRLARDLSGSFGSKPYIFEELCAEIACAYILSALGVVPTVRHADYLGAWIDLLTEQNRAIVRAASAASKAADYLLACRSRLPVAEGQQHGDARARGPTAGHVVAASGLAAPLPTGAASQRQRRDEELRDGADEAGRETPGRPVAHNRPETLPWPSRNPG